MIEALVILTQRGEILLYRVYREDVGRSVATEYRLEVIAAKNIRSPVHTVQQQFSFLHMQVENIYIAAACKQNANAAMVFEIFNKFVDVFRAYCGGKISEHLIRTHYILAFELLDEMMDWGYPQLSDIDTLRPFITQKGKTIKPEKLKAEQMSKITTQVTGATPWRTGDIRYKTNEVYLDVIESVNLLVSVDGKILHADVSGKIMIRAYLSGIPECKFGLNDKISLEREGKAVGNVQRGGKGGVAIDSCTFHQCVKLSKFDQDRTISFIPPDGEFELMKYRTTSNIEVPFKVLPNIKEHSKTRLEYHVAVKSTFTQDMFGSNVVVKIPVPKNCSKVDCRVQTGKARYRPEDEAILWKIHRFPGQCEFHFYADVEITYSVHQPGKVWSRPPISMEFTVPMFTSSGLHVRFLKVLPQRETYDTVKWVRYLTQAGNYQYRI